MENVNVLMATYNGGHFLEEQIDSILQQQKVSVSLLIRDDGSSDNTIDILSRYQERGALRYFSDDVHLGPAKGFLYLLRQSSDDASYYAFSDQDDYWGKDKLSIALDKLKEFGCRPALYFSRTQLTDEHLNRLPSPQINPVLTFGESLIHEFIPGCTMVMNKPLRDIVNSYEPLYLPMHDVWIYSVALAVGAQIVFDREPHILYRQHGNNTIGQGYSIWHEWKRRWSRFSSNEQSRSRRAMEIRKGFASVLVPENLALLDDFVSGKYSLMKRIRLMGDRRLRCTVKTTQMLFWLNILINKY